MSEHRQGGPDWVNRTISILTLVGLLCAGVTWGADTYHGYKTMVREHAAMRTQLEAIETRGINTANELTATRTEMNKGFGELKTELAKKAEKRR